MMQPYHEYVDAHDLILADACKCEMGQTVARVYSDAGVAEFAGTREEAEAFVAEKMKEVA